MSSVPRYQLTTNGRGLPSLLWGSHSVWDKLVSSYGGSVAKDDFVPYTSQAVTEAPRGLIRGGPSGNTTDFALVAGQHGVVRIDYNTTAGDTVYLSTQVNQLIDFDLIDEGVFSVRTTLNEDDELFADGGTVDFIGFSNVLDILNTSDGVQVSTTATGDNALGLLIAADGDVSLITKPNGSTAAHTVIVADFATVTKGSGVFHQLGVKVKRNGDGTFLVTGIANDVLSATYGTRVAAASVGTTACLPTIASQTPGGTSGQVPAINLDSYACLNEGA